MDGIAALASTPGKDVLDRIASLEKENASLRESKKLTYRITYRNSNPISNSRRTAEENFFKVRRSHQ